MADSLAEENIEPAALNNETGGKTNATPNTGADTTEAGGGTEEASRGVHKTSHDHVDVSAPDVPLAQVEEDLLKPLWVAHFISDYPCAVCWCIFILVIGLGAIDSLVFGLSDSATRTFFVDDASVVQHFDSTTLAAEVLASSGGANSSVPAQTELESFFTVYWMFGLTDYGTVTSDTDYWVLTPDNVEIMLTYEESVTLDPEWYEQFCYVVETSTYDCEYTSLIRDIAVNWDYNFSAMTTEGIKEFVLDLYYSSDSQGTIESLFNSEFPSTNQTTVYRSFLLAGLPIGEHENSTNGSVVVTSEYQNNLDDSSGQEDIFNDWARPFWEDITVDNEARLEDGELTIVCYIFTIYQEYFNTLLLASMSWVAAAIIAVLFWVTVHLQSIFLSVLALFQIIFSFPVAYFIYRYILDIQHFDVLSMLIIFVLLGVGADDVFVFTDAWRQSLHFVKDKSDLNQRMSFAYRRAASAMLVTQTTTFCAFLATAFSQIMPISAFGVWASCIVACNYMLVITMYPALIIIHQKYVYGFERKYCCCCCDKVDENGTKMKHKSQTDLGIEMTTGDSNMKNDDDDGIPPALTRHKSVEETAENYGWLERFFAITYVKYIIKYSIYVLILFAIIFGVAIWQASELEEQSEDETWFPDSHYMARAAEFSDRFAASEEADLVYVTIMWGIDGVDRSGTDPWDPEDYGTLDWDNSFDLSSVDAQLWMYEKCENLTQNELVFQESSVSCPMTEFKEYLESIDESFPYSYTNLSNSDASYNDTKQSISFRHMIYDFKESDEAFYINQYSLLYVESASQRDDNIPYLKFIGIGAYTSTSFYENLIVSREAEDKWDAWVSDNFNNNDDCPDHICNAYQSSLRWCWMRTNAEFIASAFQGIGIALPLAFLVLLISTRNWIMSIFATMDIIGVMACELGMMHALGWQFGISESVAIVIVIGFSVDYVVHLANAYLESTGGVRSERLSFSLLTMGISVVSGAITTLLAGFFLTFPDIIFFYKMGILIVTTIIFSLAWSMLFFAAVVGRFGPQYDIGTIPFHKLKTICGQNQMHHD